jgi:predicted HTH transcriptional regulator
MDVGQKEILTQKRVVTLFREQLDYDYLGDWTDRAGNRNIEEEYLRTFLRDKQGYDEALFLARYIEKYGTGTLMMIRESLAHALPEPDFTQRGGEFTITLWRDWLTAELMIQLDLNDRQRLALAYLKIHGKNTNAEYQQVASA